MGTVKVHNRFSLLDRYKDGDQTAGELFVEFVDATKCKQIISELHRLVAAQRVYGDLAAGGVADAERHR